MTSYSLQHSDVALEHRVENTTKRSYESTFLYHICLRADLSAIKRLTCEIQFDDEWAEDRSMAIGIAAGYVNLIATQLGYSTGCCKCMDSDAITEIIGEAPILMMGVGFPDIKKNRREHHTENFKFPTLKKMKNIETVLHA